MADRPINLRDWESRAIQAGTKRQLRRVLKPQPPAECGINYRLGDESWLPKAERSPLRHHWEAWHGDLFHNRPEGHLCGSHEVRLPFAPGDRLWCRESLRAASNDQGVRWFSYAADGADVWPMTLWTKDRNSIPSIHMPRWASRLTLVVTEVRVQRLREISEADALAEGVRVVTWDGGQSFHWAAGEPSDAPGGNDPVEAFKHLWNRIHGHDAWSANPWGVAVSFTVHHRNIDTMEASHAAA